MIRLLIITAISCLPFLAYSQCAVTERVLPDGTMYYHAETLLFYKTSSFQLSGNVVTDKENYFLRLRPLPFPEKPAGTKLKANLDIVLDNDSTYTLRFYDAYYNEADTSFSALYLFDSKKMQPFRDNEVKEVKIDLGDGVKNYTFRLHKEALKVQLACFMQPKSKL